MDEFDDRNQPSNNVEKRPDAIAGEKRIKVRNLVGFWFLGLTNNFAYVVMLSAAYDILKSLEHHEEPHYVPDNRTVVPWVTLGSVTSNRSGNLIPYCNKIGTGAILLADMLPALFIKLTAPFYMQSISYTIRVIVVILFGTTSFPIVSSAHSVALSLFGVVCASLNSGLGEITFLSLSSYFDKNVISTWSSGTGAAGIAGALVYAGLTALHVSPRRTLLIMLVVPAVMGVSYFVLMVRPKEVKLLSCSGCSSDSGQESLLPLSPSIPEEPKKIPPKLTLQQKFRLMLPLLKYMIPLSLVYLGEYFINQALFELVYFEDIWLSPDQQYRWYQVIYHFGVLFSRSSVNLFQVKKTWIFTILQFVNVVIFLLQIFLKFIPSIWIVFALVLFEGLLGGCAYVNTFYRITLEVQEEYREFSLGVASLADSLGVSLAGAFSVPVHNWFCTL